MEVKVYVLTRNGRLIDVSGSKKLITKARNQWDKHKKDDAVFQVVECKGLAK